MCIYTKGIKFVLYCLLIVLTLHSNARFCLSYTYIIKETGRYEINRGVLTMKPRRFNDETAAF